MSRRRPRHLLILVMALAGCFLPRSQAGFLAEYTRRLDALRADRPAILRSADQAAGRRAEHPQALLNIPYGEQPAFAEELINRAGGLSEALPSVERMRQTTPHDIVLFSVRSWEKDGKAAIRHIADYRGRGWWVILFASRAGMPDGLAVDVLIDNHAPDGGEASAPVNVLANVTAAWLWCIEYAAALTRRGHHPGILKSIMLPDAQAHNQPLQQRAGRPVLHPWDAPMAPDTGSGVFLDRIGVLLEHLESDDAQRQRTAAAALIVAAQRAGRPPVLITCTHILMHEIFLNLKTPWRPINVVHRSRTALAKVDPDDLIVWMGYVGMGTPLEDYHSAIRNTGARLIACYLPDDIEPSNNAAVVEAIIDQSWQRGDAVVPIPFPPGAMAPISGIEQKLIFRMLDETVAAMVGE